MLDNSNSTTFSAVSSVEFDTSVHKCTRVGMFQVRISYSLPRRRKSCKLKRLCQTRAHTLA